MLAAPSRSQPPQHRALGEREAMLGAQPPHQLTEHHAQLAGTAGRASADSARSCMRTIRRQEVTAQVTCIIPGDVPPTIASARSRTRAPRVAAVGSDRYKWIALSNVTLGVLLATLDASITLIAMPDIFRGIHLDPLVPANSFYLLWMILGFLVVSSVLIVSLGRLGDMFGRVRIYNLGFVIYTVASLLLTVDWMTGRAGRDLPDRASASSRASARPSCSPTRPRSSPTRSRPTSAGWRSGINNIVGVSGMFVGLVLGGLLAPIDWRLVFLISVPVGLFGTVWAYLKLEERSKPRRAPIDWWGNVTFALGLILIMVSVTYGIRPYGAHATGWSSPRVIALLAAGVACLLAFARDRAARGRPDVPAAAVPHPRVHLRHALDLPLGGRARRADVHADHLAAGHLAARARLRLHRDAAVGGHLHAAADARDADRRPDLRLPLRPLRRAPVRHRRDARRRGQLPAAVAAADRLPATRCSRSCWR